MPQWMMYYHMLLGWWCIKAQGASGGVKWLMGSERRRERSCNTTKGALWNFCVALEAGRQCLLADPVSKLTLATVALCLRRIVTQSSFRHCWTLGKIFSLLWNIGQFDLFELQTVIQMKPHVQFNFGRQHKRLESMHCITENLYQTSNSC